MMAASVLSVLMVIKWGYTATTTVKSSYETLLWTRRVSKKIWKKSPFRRHKTEVCEKKNKSNDVDNDEDYDDENYNMIKNDDNNNDTDNDDILTN